MIRAVLLDAHGTLLRLRPPAPALRHGLAELYGLEIGPGEAERAIAAEVRYYRAHLSEGRDGASVAALRSRCAGVLRQALIRPAERLPGGVDDRLLGGVDERLLGGADERLLGGVDEAAMTALLLASLVFEPFPEVPATLNELRGMGLALVVVSNWDASLSETLASLGLLDTVDAVVTSAACGSAKPDPAIFAEALRRAGVGPEEALHVGDSPEEDVAGARAAGIGAVLVAREGERGGPDRAEERGASDRAEERGASDRAEERGASERAGVPEEGDGIAAGDRRSTGVVRIASLANLPRLLREAAA
jgi:putative hydrolase of the HAD superfamily